MNKVIATKNGKTIEFYFKFMDILEYAVKNLLFEGYEITIEWAK